MAGVKKEIKSDEMPTWSYEEKVAQVEGIIGRIEAGDLDLEQIFEQFSQAVEYLQECQTFLQGRQQQVDLLIETLQDD
ncbi:MAG: exodeoxyribonuclease VII small subunit [Calothrix sp. MO_167.B42]|nr:exodeoxyribonuclease VII small subunit [Calothrix sp. MO_167.B42]